MSNWPSSYGANFCTQCRVECAEARLPLSSMLNASKTSRLHKPANRCHTDWTRDKLCSIRTTKRSSPVWWRRAGSCVTKSTATFWSPPDMRSRSIRSVFDDLRRFPDGKNTRQHCMPKKKREKNFTFPKNVNVTGPF